MQTGASLIPEVKAKSAGSQSSFGCYLSSLSDSDDKPYAFWSVYLHYPKQIVSDANGLKAAYKYRLKDDDGDIYLLANCVIPATKEAAALVDELLRESIREYEKSNTTQGKMTASLQSSSDLFCDLPNSEGFSCAAGSCWYSLDMNTCCGPHPVTGELSCGTPEVEVVAEIEECTTDCGEPGGGGTPWPPPSDGPDDPWVPGDGGNGGGPCLTCEPGEDPNDTDGEQVCPLGTINDGFGNCIGEEEDEDCMGVEGGLAYLDSCGICVEGTSTNVDCCATLQKILDTISESEGTAYTDDPDDSGGKTKHGIAWNTWQNYSHLVGKSPTASNLQNLTRANADIIYENTFWIWSQADRIEDGDLRKMYFDFFVNAPSAAVRALQQALYDNGYIVSIDGKLGSETWSNIDQAFYDGKIMSLYNSFKSARIQFYYDQSLKDNNQKYLNGWINRANKFENKTIENLRGVTCDV